MKGGGGQLLRMPGAAGNEAQEPEPRVQGRWKGGGGSTCPSMYAAEGRVSALWWRHGGWRSLLTNALPRLASLESWSSVRSVWFGTLTLGGAGGWRGERLKRERLLHPEGRRRGGQMGTEAWHSFTDSRYC